MKSLYATRACKIGVRAMFTACTMCGHEAILNSGHVYSVPLSFGADTKCLGHGMRELTSQITFEVMH
jgi:hypothetical protein